jgi:hypothetical protein
VHSCLDSDLLIINARERAAPDEDDERRKFLREQPELAKGHLQRSDQFGTVFRGLLLRSKRSDGLRNLAIEYRWAGDAPSTADIIRKNDQSGIRLAAPRLIASLVHKRRRRDVHAAKPRGAPDFHR